MGVIISRFRRKKTTSEVLEKLERKIRSIEQRGQWTQLQHRRVITHMTAYGVGVYVLFAILYYFVYTGRSATWLHAVMYASPLLVLPVLVLMLRSTISWYYNRRLDKDRSRLTKMRDEKKKLLEEVMNTETYKVAKEILEKYGEPDKQLKPFVPTTNVPGNSTPSPATPGQLKQRQLALQNAPATPISHNMSFTSNVGLRTPLRPEQLPHPLVPNQQSALDRVLNFFLNDGADKRFALICSGCASHNGMVFEELFDYTSYKCAYCGKFNASRKQRPRAPPLAVSPARGKPLALMHVPQRVVEAPSSSESEDENLSGTESSVDASQPPSEPQPDAPEPVKSADEKKED